MPEPWEEGPQPFVRLYSTSSLVLLGVPAETQPQWSWDPRKEFDGSLHQMGNVKMLHDNQGLPGGLTLLRRGAVVP